MTRTSPLPGRHATAVLLVAAPLFELAETLLSPLKDGSTGSELGLIAAHQGRFEVSVLLGMVAVLLFVPTFLGLANSCVARTPRLATFAGWTAATSMLGFFGVRGIQAVQLAMVQNGLDHARAGRIIDHSSANPLGILVLLVFLGGTVVGVISLGVATWRAGLPRAAAVLLVLFPFLDNGPPLGHLGTVLAHGVLLVSLTWFATALWTRHDARLTETVPVRPVTA